MRNTKIALAVLALVASTAAMANGATVYGTIDTAVSKQTNQATTMNHSTWGTSVFGIKGSDDLDGGMKATYQLEAGIDSTTGSPFANGGPLGLFNRAANVGLSGEFGSVKIGNQLSPYIAAALGGTVTDNASYYVPMLLLSASVSPTSYNTAYSTTGVAAKVGTGGFFIPNAISYSTPSIGGFSATALKQLAGVKGQSTPTTSPNFEDYTAYSASFNAGDVSVSAGYESNGALGAALAGNFTNSGVLAFGAKTTAYTVGSTYTMGALKLGAGYMKMDFGFGSAGTTVYHLGAAYSVSEQLAVNLNYANANNGNGSLLADTSVFTPTAAKSNIINLGTKYSLSKRTYAYGTISRATNGALAVYNTANTSVAGDTTGYAVGVGHNF
jgi:predicted porin